MTEPEPKPTPATPRPESEFRAAVREVCENIKDWTLDHLTLTYRTPRQYYRYLRKPEPEGGEGRSRSSAFVSVLTAEFIKSAIGATGFNVSPVVGTASVIAANVAFNVLLAKPSWLNRDEPILPRRHARLEARRPAPAPRPRFTDDLDHSG